MRKWLDKRRLRKLIRELKKDEAMNSGMLYGLSKTRDLCRYGAKELGERLGLSKYHEAQISHLERRLREMED